MMKTRLLLFIFLVVFSACNQQLDMAGMFVTYQPVNSRFDESMSWNALHPAKEIVTTSDEYLVYAMGDSHVGGTDNLGIFLQAAKDSNAAAVLMAGDLTTGKEQDYLVLRKLIPPQDSLVTFLLAGNHDLYFDGWQYFYSLFGSSVYYFTVKTPVATDLFICLDSGSATLGSKQMDWLKTILKEIRPGFRRCIIVSHSHLLFSSHEASTNPMTEEQVVLIDLLASSQADIFIAGHNHKQDSYTFGNTLFLVMDALKDGLDNAGYLVLKVKNGEFDYRFIRL